MDTLEFFFDCSSPWTYLGFESLQGLASRHPDVSLVYRPILVGGVFNAVNPSVYENRSHPVPAKQRYYAKDLADWAQYVGVTIGQPPVFPVNSVKAMRGALVAIEQDKLVPYTRLVFRRYWTDLRDISLEAELLQIVSEVGIDVGHFQGCINNPEYKARLRQNTEDLIARGGFGSPTLFLNGTDMYFGNDRMALLESRL